MQFLHKVTLTVFLSSFVPLAFSPSWASTSGAAAPANTIRAIRTVERGVEIEVHSTRPFPVRALPAVLRIGGEQFVRSRYAKGRLDTLIFLLSEEEFASLHVEAPVSVQYGKGKARARHTWDFGRLDKSQRVDGRSGS